MAEKMSLKGRGKTKGRATQIVLTPEGHDYPPTQEHYAHVIKQHAKMPGVTLYEFIAPDACRRIGYRLSFRTQL